MGSKKEGVRVVIDTNVLISALVFGGEISAVVDLWKNGIISPFISREIFDEIIKVLAYPKFELSKDEIDLLINEEILPFFEIVEAADLGKMISRDPDDDKFIACALSSCAKYIITGDKDLLSLDSVKKIKVITVRDLLKKING